MNGLEMAILETLRIWKEEGIAKSTFESRKRYCTQLFQKASEMGKQDIDQELVYVYLKANNNGSKETATMHYRIAKRVDAVCSTHLVDLKGHYLNTISYPTEEAAGDFFRRKSFPVNESVPLTFLITKTLMEVGKAGLTESTIGQYKKALKDFNEHASQNGVFNYSRSFCNGYLSQNETDHGNGEIKTWVRKLRRRSLMCLLYVAEHGDFSWRRFTRFEDSLPVDMQEIERVYLHELEARNLEPKTIDLHRYVTHEMLIMFQKEQTQHLRTLDTAEITHMLGTFSQKCNTNSMNTIVPIIRVVLAFLYLRGYVEKDFGPSIMTPRCTRKRAKGFISLKDEKRLIREIASLNKRDKAILLLALETGLRESDILGMRFSQLDWKKNTITVSQKKTGELLVLPLLADVGNSLAAYILEERPKHPEAGFEGYVFLRRQAPYRKVSSVYGMVRKLLESTKISPVNTHKAGGIHLFRHSLVYKLLKEHVPEYTITQVLGHVSRESDKPYLSLDDTMLKECAMADPLPASGSQGGY